MNDRGQQAGDVVGGPLHALPGIAGLPRGAAVGSLLPPAHPVPRAGGSGAGELRGLPRQRQRIDAGGRRQAAHRRGRPVELDGVAGGAAAVGGGHRHRDGLGLQFLQGHRFGGFLAEGGLAVHRHRGGLVAGGGGDRHRGHAQGCASPVLERRRVEGGGDRNRLAVLVGHRQRAQLRIVGLGPGCRHQADLLAVSRRGPDPYLDLVSHQGGESGDGVLGRGRLYALWAFVGLPLGAAVGGPLPPAHPVVRIAADGGACKVRLLPRQRQRVFAAVDRRVPYHGGRPFHPYGVGGLGVGGGHVHKGVERPPSMSAWNREQLTGPVFVAKKVHLHRRGGVEGSGGDPHPRGANRHEDLVLKGRGVEGGSEGVHHPVRGRCRQRAQRGVVGLHYRDRHRVDAQVGGIRWRRAGGDGVADGAGARRHAANGECLGSVPVGGGERVGGGQHGGLGVGAAGGRDGDVARRRLVHDDRVGARRPLHDGQRGRGHGHRGRVVGGGGLGGRRCPSGSGQHGGHQRQDHERGAWGLDRPHHVLPDRGVDR